MKAVAREYEAAVGDVGGEFRRRALERNANGSMMVTMHSASTSQISESSTAIILGTPSMRLLPMMSIVIGLS